MEPSPGAATVGGIGFLLDRVAHSLTRAFEPAIAPFGLRNTHLGVLSAVALLGPQSQSRLAAHLGIERQQMVNLVDHLVRRGLVVRADDHADRRRLRITLTRAGEQVRDQAVAAAREHERTAFAPLSAEERDQLAALLLRLVPSGHFRDLFTAPPAAGRRAGDESN